MPRATTSRSRLTALAVLAVAALSGCQGGADATEGTGPESREHQAKVAQRGRGAEEAGRAEQRDERDVAERDVRHRRDEREEERERAEVGAVLAELPARIDADRADSIDLEFTEGLPEPPQQQVVPSPAPWTPEPDAEAAAKPVIEDVWPDKAPASGGERIVIRGKNLTPAQVVFGLSPARILGVSDSRDTLTVAAPPCEVGRVAIVVTNRDGNYALSKWAFQYYE